MRKRLRRILYVTGLCLLIMGCQTKEEVQIPFEPVEEQSREEEKQTIFVNVCGAVEKEGVYELPSGSRVYQAIEAAGGFTEEAVYTSLNQAELLKDEALVYVPTEKEYQEAQTVSDGKVNLNTASKEELMTVNGIGASRAESIIQYREEHGKFQNIEDIQKVDGIKEGLFNKIKDSITI